MEQVFAEKRGYAVQHIFMPAAIYYYTQNIYKFFTIIFLFESFEYLFGQIDPNWGEAPGDSLVGDILMGILGMIAVRQFKHETKPWWYIALHILILVAASVVTVQVFPQEITAAYIFYACIASVSGVLISTNWALFTLLNVLIIAAIATKGFTAEFSHTPIAAIISIVATTAALWSLTYLKTRPTPLTHSLSTRDLFDSAPS